MPVILAMFYHNIDITEKIVWTIINACSYALPSIYTCDNNSVLLLYCGHTYNHIAILVQSVILKVNKLVKYFEFKKE